MSNDSRNPYSGNSAAPPPVPPPPGDSGGGGLESDGAFGGWNAPPPSAPPPPAPSGSPLPGQSPSGPPPLGGAWGGGQAPGSAQAARSKAGCIFALAAFVFVAATGIAVAVFFATSDDPSRGTPAEVVRTAVTAGEEVALIDVAFHASGREVGEVEVTWMVNGFPDGADRRGVAIRLESAAIDGGAVEYDWTALASKDDSAVSLAGKAPPINSAMTVRLPFALARGVGDGGSLDLTATVVWDGRRLLGTTIGIDIPDNEKH